VSGETIRLSVSLRLAVEFLHVMYIKYKQMQVFNLIFHLLCASRITALSLLSKGKAIPLQAWTGREGSRRLRLPDFKTIGT